MSDWRGKGKRQRAALVALVACWAVSCHHDGEATSHGSHGALHRSVTAEVLVLAAPDGHGARPAVEFRHTLHSEAAGEEGCETCHERQDDQLLPALKGVGREARGDERRDAFHRFCVDCHEGQAAERMAQGQANGPPGAECGACHRRQPRAESERQPMRFDLSLHQRHVAAEQDRCESCHHVYNEGQKQLEYRQGTEEGCSACHGAQDDGRRLSLRHAAHLACINCHLRRDEGQATGPVECGGCHDRAQQLEIEKLENPPRLQRGQPDRMWLYTPGATSHVVAFDHGRHEGHTDRCATCHHQGLQKCGDCHSVTGRPEGGGVTLEQAFHARNSEHSCVGCHQRVVMADKRCAGCHQALTEVPSPQSCPRCHIGPQPSEMAHAKLDEALAPPVTAPLPDRGQDFPDVVNIDVLREVYGPSPLAHGDIVQALNEEASQSTLALHFHGGAGAPCAGCHHRSAQGTRPPPCRACHRGTAAERTDQPALLAAYHRQCIGCHQEMELETGCTVCHEPATGAAVQESAESASEGRSQP